MQERLRDKIKESLLFDEEIDTFDFYSQYFHNPQLIENAAFLDGMDSCEDACKIFKDIDFYYHFLGLIKPNFQDTTLPGFIPSKDLFEKFVYKIIFLVIDYVSQRSGQQDCIKIISSMKIGLRKFFFAENINPKGILKKIKEIEQIIKQDSPEVYPYLTLVSEETLDKLYRELKPDYIENQPNFNKILRGIGQGDKIIWKRYAPELCLILHFLYSKESENGCGFISDIKIFFESSRFNIDNLVREYNEVRKNEIHGKTIINSRRKKIRDILAKCNLYEG